MEFNIYTRKRAKGKLSLYWQMTGAGEPIRESFKGMFIYDKPKGALQKEHNADVMELCHGVMAKKRLEFMADEQGFGSKAKQQIDFVKYFEQRKDKYAKKDKRKVEASFEHFKKFLLAERGLVALPGKDLTPQLCKDFGEYLKTKLEDESARSYLLKFKNILDRAFEDKIAPINSATFKVKFSIDKNAIKKPMLDPEEIQTLIKTPCSNNQIRRAFLLSLNTGLDYATVSKLCGWMVDKNRLIFDRSKTDTQNSFPLTKTALALIGKIEDPEAKIFQLPGWAGCVKAIRKWAEDAEINKKLTWHSARHSFGTNLSNDYDVDVMVIRDLMGHKDVRTTQRYVKIKDKKKRAAVDKLPEMDIDSLPKPKDKL